MNLKMPENWITQHLIDRRYALSSLGGLGLYLTLKTWPAFAGSRTAEQVVTQFHDALLGIMQQAKSLDYKGRFRKLQPHIVKNFHLPIMIRIATGRFWRNASPRDQDRLLKVFTDISIGTYASRFSNYSGQKFLNRGFRKGPQDTILVDTIIYNPNAADVPITYVTREIQGSWHIIDILLASGISEIAVRRAEYRRLLQSDGIEGLISSITEKLESLETAN